MGGVEDRAFGNRAMLAIEAAAALAAMVEAATFAPMSVTAARTGGAAAVTDLGHRQRKPVT